MYQLNQAETIHCFKGSRENSTTPQTLAVSSSQPSGVNSTRGTVAPRYCSTPPSLAISTAPRRRPPPPAHPYSLREIPGRIRNPITHFSGCLLFLVTPKLQYILPLFQTLALFLIFLLFNIKRKWAIVDMEICVQIIIACWLSIKIVFIF
jgi:hypothetical protein